MGIRVQHLSHHLSSEAEGTSRNTETEALMQAIKRALDSIFNLNKIAN